MTDQEQKEFDERYSDVKHYIDEATNTASYTVTFGDTTMKEMKDWINSLLKKREEELIKAIQDKYGEVDGIIDLIKNHE